MRLPNIIVLDGIDGCAKSTQAALLADYLDARGGSGDPSYRECLRAKFPAYDTSIGKLIASKLRGQWSALEAREIPEGWHDRYQHLNALVLQSLMLTNRFEVADEIERAVTVEGRTAVLDRYSLSAFAYGMADGLDLAWLEKVHTRLPKAHTVFIDIPVEESFKRRPKRTDAYEADRGRLEKARANYLHVLQRYGVDTSYWGHEEPAPSFPVEKDFFNWRTSPSGYYLVNGLGTVDEVQTRIRKALGL